MEPKEIAIRLAANAEVFRHLLENVAHDQAGWKPNPAKWSLLEVINHLADEEREDFRARLELTLEHPGTAWPPIDPPGWVLQRDYAARDLSGSLADFLRERQSSVEWLRRLDGYDPEASYRHPVAGTITAGALLHSWLAHDLIHIRQMTRLHYEFLADREGTASLAYAGDW